MKPRDTVIVLRQTGELKYIEIDLDGYTVELPGMTIEMYKVKIVGAYGTETISVEVNTKGYTYEASFGGGKIEINEEILIPLKFATISERGWVNAVPEKWVDLDSIHLDKLTNMVFHATILPDPENTEVEYDYELVMENGKFI
ncbi:MAG: hypothetical protein QG641_2292 [Candidatus Poribacteria bacterium]|nr:hypothetical protein [Candidatus Poribacteria bacterium]